MNINDLIKEAHENAVAHGFWEEERPFAELIALMHSDLSEALEEYRDGRGLNEIYYSCSCDRSCPYTTGRSDCYQCEYNKPEGIPRRSVRPVGRVPFATIRRIRRGG